MSPEQLAGLSPEARRELLARMLATRSAPAPADPTSPCSHGQRSLWFMHQLAPESSVYNVTFAWRIKAGVDAAAMRRAFDALVARHEALRTTYESRDGEPRQRVHAALPFAWQVRAIGACDDATLVSMLVEDARRPFNLATGPVLRASLYALDETDHVLLVTIHHIACDLWSVELLLDDLRAFYHRESAGSGVRADGAASPGRYRDFGVWQRQMLESEEGRAHWEYWQQKLAGDLPRLDLPTDRPRPAVQSFAGDGVKFPVPADLMAALRERAARDGSTLFTIFLTAFQALLVRYSGQDGVLVGSVSSGRSRREFEPTVGYFVNPIVFRCDVSDDPTFRDLLARTRLDVLAALDHQDFPFPLLVERLNVDRDASRSPLADAYFVWDKHRNTDERMTTTIEDHEARVRMDWDGMPLEAFPLTQIGTPSDLAMVVFEVGPSISVNIGYSTALFDRSTIERMSEHFVTLLREVAADPDRRISRLPLVSAADRSSARQAVSTTRLALAADEALHRRFERHVAARPDAIALTCAGRQLTYRELNDRADLLAARLRAKGVGRDQLVGLFLDRDLDLVVAVLGILKAGAAYLPIDRAYPDERIAFMLQDAGASVIITHRELAGDVPPGLATDPLFIDDPAEPGIDVRPVDAGTRPDDLAYVIYTSGSTGQPKGVMVTHRNVLRLFDATSHWFAFDDRDVWSLFHSIAFDFSVWELWGALLYGGRLVVVPFDVSRSPEAMLDVLASEGVTVLNQTPSAFRQLIAADAARATVQDLALRHVIFGGEALDVRMLRPWFDRRGDRRPTLVNMFGITETTVHVTYRVITRDDLTRRISSPIGVAIPDLRLVVVDAAGHPVPAGVPGELCVAGAGVARGYLNRPALTAERFVPDPTSTDPTARMYRSGDLVRLDGNGELEYLGRIDQQVKIRGFRIELGEIQAAVSQHPAVEQSAVIVRRDGADDPRIVAYVVLRAGADATPADFQMDVRRRLPEYMVPSAFVRLSRLPLTMHGKLDVRALPLPDQTESHATRPYVAPRNDIERAIADAWARLLGIGRVGVDDDFFELGGHSILATGLTAWVREHFHVDFPIYAVFERPTVAAMASHVEALSAVAAPATTVSSGDREEFEL